MERLIVILLLAGSTAANYKLNIWRHENNTFQPLSDDYINHINNDIKPHWKAGRNFHPETDMGYIRSMMGALTEPKEVRLPVKKRDLSGLAIPENFDARVKWPYCESLKEIRDQGGCGSCWAFAATEAMTDRWCIATAGKSKFRFSAENLVSCCGLLSLCGFGCNGGFPSSAWRYWVSHGIVSGGPTTPTRAASRTRSPPASTTPPAQDRTARTGIPQNSYGVSSKVEQIQAEILMHGPVEAAMMVYDDLLLYKSGVYHHVKGFRLGGHAIKIIGWGVENNMPYWLIANSWNYDWGDQGMFKLLRGKNECGIESLGIVAGIPKARKRIFHKLESTSLLNSTYTKARNQPASAPWQKRPETSSSTKITSEVVRNNLAVCRSQP
ncbi:Cathepsin B [Orchesella cincta]|uniref:Cathepsin B n=1 Tax=Orchesella cincta TaxID=48709 RepID=A0A1D2MVU2_ORCCI|nr:Cathepsin B [Orchesella cincta]